MSLKMHISQAVRKRNGKKYRITKMIPEIKTLVGQRGSRTQIRFLKTSLDETLKSAIEYHEALMILLPDDDPRFSDEWIEKLALSVNTCFAAIEAYEVARREKHVVNLYCDYRRKYICIAESFYCVSLTLQFFTVYMGIKHVIVR